MIDRTPSDVLVEVRLAEPDDLAGMLALLLDDEVARSRGDYSAEVTPQVRHAFAEITEDPNNELWIAEQNNEIVAMLQMTLIPGLSRGGMKRAQVEAVRVKRELRGKGVGSALMFHVTRRARLAGCEMIQLSSDARRTDAHRFYQRLGYEASHVGMKKKL